ncbi:MAG: tRNA preQ1(34) S-adenosylmethionine ribosyltransferase-isomerase QueA [Anaerolineales bacterium]|nr:tRNA preQ1(34) S-adenosylmethionine ribosyltransferase-isomerase QueA [Anaerolineales bacterium]
MQLIDFNYELPEELIAQTPVEPRDASRLMVLDKHTGSLTHNHFNHLPELLRPGDVLVFNDTRVIPARLMAHKSTGGHAEIFLLKRLETRTWEVLVGGKNIRPGAQLKVEGEADLHAEIIEQLEGARRVVRFSKPISPLLSHVGEMPLPPYIHTRLNDPERYQTVYAQKAGSAAAPTAGLHFSADLLKRLDEKGIIGTFVTLHVGLDTFQPVGEPMIEQHKMHGEWCEMRGEAAQAVNAAKREGRRVIAVGTTSVRVLETAARHARASQPVSSFSAMTDIFIYPGYQFQVIDGLITNFHLPKSTLLMLVSALAGREHILAAYEAAKCERYRFYSFGDAMLIV